MTGGGGEIGGAVGESGCALIAEEGGLVAEEEEVEVVIVVVVDPHGGLEATLGHGGGGGGPATFGVVEELRACVGDDAQVHQAVVVVIAGGDGTDGLELGEAGVGDESGAATVELDAGGRPGEQV